MTKEQLAHIVKLARDENVPYLLGNDVITFFPDTYHYSYDIYDRAFDFLSILGKNQITERPKQNHLK